MPEISQQDIDNIVAILQRDEVPVTQFGVEDPDPLVIEGKMDYVLDAIKGIPQGPKGDTGAQGPEGPQGPKGDNGEVSQAQLDEVINAVAANVDGIARVEQQKQDKLAQVDLDNIASINQMKDDITGKQDKLSDTQLQAIGEIDAIKGIALDNQANKASKAEVTELASQVNTNATEISKKLTGSTIISNKANFVYTIKNEPAIHWITPSYYATLVIDGVEYPTPNMVLIVKGYSTVVIEIFQGNGSVVQKVREWNEFTISVKENFKVYFTKFKI